MLYLVFIAVALVLLAGFFALTAYETNRGTRFFEGFRSKLDRDVEHAEFIITHVDLAAFLRDEVRRLSARFGHDVVHLALRIVRFAERLLTRLVRHLRMHQAASEEPRETSREFVKTLSDFKGHLEANRPEVPSVHDVEE